MTSTHITGVRTISIPVDDQDAALQFFVDTLGFTVARDSPTPNGGRWIELTPGQSYLVVTLEPAAPNVTRGAIGIRFTTDDAEAAHAALVAAGVDTDDILRWPGVPAMFAFRDPDGNAFSVTETAKAGRGRTTTNRQCASAETNVVVSSPRPVTRTVTVSPWASGTCTACASASLAGVPVEMMSPGSSVTTWDR